MRSSLTVIKVGGSLFDWPEFPCHMTQFVDARRAAFADERLVLIAGGGPAADIIRAIDQTHRLGDAVAHRLALHAMDLTAHVLAALLPGTLAVQRIGAIHDAWSAGSIPVLAPRSILDEADRSGKDALPAGWHVTSDAIAAWIAGRLAADRLLLLKSAPLPPGTDRREAARLGLVDPMLPIVAQALPRVEYLNLRESVSPPWPLPR